jgi:hypothetical protein
MKVTTDGYEIEFSNAVNAYKFDEQDKYKNTYHGATMFKAVDLIVEFADYYLFVEIKNNPDDYLTTSDCTTKTPKECHDNFMQLKNILKYKFRDSFLYRFAEGKVNKPISYICLLNYDSAMVLKMSDSLKIELPVGKPSTRWKIELLKSCAVVNLERWNNNFPKWPACKTSAPA